MPVLTPFELWEAPAATHPGDLPAPGPSGTRVRPADDARGDGDVPRARDPELPAAAADALPLLDQGARRAASARRAAARARVHHEGRLLVRPRRGRARRRASQARRARTTGSSSACGLEYSAVQAESGMMGGKESIDFLAPSGSGENTLVTCENGDYAADLEIARGIPRAPEFPERRDAPEEVETPGVTTIEALAEYPRHRLRRDVEGDAGRRSRRHARARARPRRRPALGAEDARRPRQRLPAGHRRRDPGSFRRRRRLARPGRRRRRGRRRRDAA